MEILDEIQLELDRFHRKFNKAGTAIQMSKDNYRKLTIELERQPVMIYGMKIILVNTKVPIIEW